MTTERCPRVTPVAMPSPNFSQPSDIDVQALMRGLVHELRNPLSAILTASSLVQGNPDADEETTMLLEVIQKESRRMNSILTEFSHFVKPPQPNIKALDFGALAHGVVGTLQGEGALAGVEVQRDLERQLGVAGDPAHTAGALRHVLQNAAQALQDGGYLLLHLEEIDGMGCIVVEDSGGEVPPEVVLQAFQPFFSTKPAATGLGLSIARATLRAAQGDVTFENGERGARVKLCLPLQETP